MWLLVIIGFISSALLTYATSRAARRLKIVDAPDGGRKRHGRLVALWGGLPLFVSFWGVLIYELAYRGSEDLLVLGPTLLSLFGASLIFVLVGLADDLKPMSFARRLPFLIAGILFVAAFAPIGKLTNPFGGIVALGPAIGEGLVFAWLFVTTVSIKILDGVDGLAVGIGLVGSLIIAALTFSSKFYQPNVGFVALLFAAVLLGFWLFNVPPGKIFLGEGGSLFVGLMLGGLSIMAGSKIATAMLVMAVPVLDVGRVMWLRWRAGQSLFVGDRNHLHFRLIDRGWSEWQVLALLLGVAALAGGAALMLQSAQKIAALAFVGVAFILLAARFGLFKK